MLRDTVCTLFEGDYHLGVGALVNSLYQNGYRGVVWAGHRGPLPPWASGARKEDGFLEYCVAEGCVIRFVPVATKRHLTNYKPDFLLELWRERCPEAETLFYFDPDIVIKCEWAFFPEWAGYGIAVCEDVNSPLNATHPIRHAWRRFCAKHGVELPRSLDAYASGGFVGLSRQHRPQVETWKHLVDAIEGEMGQLQKLVFQDRPYAFYNGDQDMLNIMLMSTEQPLSIIGREGMDFIPGGYTMSHAAGGVKPWRKRFLKSALKGIGPSLADKNFWHYAERPLTLYPAAELRRRRLDLKLGAAVGRFLKRS